MCCRLSPNEKAVLVQFSHLFYPELTTLAIGDGANDLSMFQYAKNKVAFCAKPIVKENANIIIENKDLTELLNYI